MHFPEDRFHINAKGDGGAIHDIQQISQFLRDGRQVFFLHRLLEFFEFFLDQTFPKNLSRFIGNRGCRGDVNIELFMKFLDHALRVVHWLPLLGKIIMTNPSLFGYKIRIDSCQKHAGMTIWFSYHKKL